jgi:hypothetical protein
MTQRNIMRCEGLKACGYVNRATLGRHHIEQDANVHVCREKCNAVGQANAAQGLTQMMRLAAAGETPVGFDALAFAASATDGLLSALRLSMQTFAPPKYKQVPQRPWQSVLELHLV